MALQDLWAVEMLIAAFAGGAFGAALGALPAFIFTGFMVIAGETAAYVDADLGAITGSIAFGAPFSPAISFAGGAAAAAYAAKKGYMQSGFDYHNAKDIAFALGTKPDVLAVGGAFGILGYWFTVLSATFNMPYDHIAMGVVLSAFAHRLVFGYSIIGDTSGGILNMTPFEQGERRGGAVTDGGEARFTVEPWLPHQYKWANVTMIGLVVGILAAYIAFVTGSPFLAFGISAASLVFLNCGVEQIPVTHHMALPASTAALAAVASEPSQSVLLVMLAAGAVFGIVGALSGEVVQRVFYAHADTHLDPPAAGIVVGTFLVAVLHIAGILPGSSWVATLGM